MDIIFSAYTLSGNPSTRFTYFVGSSLRYIPVQTAPSPIASAAKRIFSEAAEQSCTQTSLLNPAFLSPQTAIATAASLNIRVPREENESVSSKAGSEMTTNDHGRLSPAVGAAIPALKRISIYSLLTGLSRYFLTLLPQVYQVSVKKARKCVKSEI